MPDTMKAMERLLQTQLGMLCRVAGGRQQGTESVLQKCPSGHLDVELRFFGGDDSTIDIRINKAVLERSITRAV